jgi:LmbE family N-acetylglucosaminyl deacetylase
VLRAAPLLLALLLAPLLAEPARAQAAEQEGAEALGVSLRRLGQTARVLMIGAHPDDENTALLAELALGHGADVAYLSLTRGEGGQNLIGPELQEALGLIRTEELLAARRLDGARQYFTRAYDFGFSKSAEETFGHWPREEVLADVVETIRRFRPDIIITIFGGTPADGHGHHQASGLLAREAFRAAADPARFPEQLARGLEPHAAGSLFHAPYRPVASPTLTVATGAYDPLFGRSRFQIAMQSRSLHRSQDMGSAQPPGPHASQLVLLDGAPPPAGALSPLATADSLLSQRVRRQPATALSALLRDYEALAAQARAAYTPLDTRPLTAALARAALLLDEAGDIPSLEPALSAERRDVRDALRRASGIVVDATADGGSVVPGGTLDVTFTVWNGGGESVLVSRVRPLLPRGWSARLDDDDAPRELEPGAVLRRRMQVHVPHDADVDEPYFLRSPRDGAMYVWPDDEARGASFEPRAVGVEFELLTRGVTLTVEREVRHLRVDKALGEIRTPVLVVPRFTVSLSPALRALPHRDGAAAPVELQATVTAHAAAGSALMLHLDAPAGWRVEPATVPLAFEGAGASVVARATLHPPPRVAPGRVEVRAWLGNGGASFDRALEIVEYAHIERRALYRNAVARVMVLDAAIAADLHVGYIEGAGDDGAAALAQLGARVTHLSPDELATGDLARYDAIVSGVRAYEVRPDILRHNGRLLEYVRQGGTYVAQYNKYEFPEGGFPPYPFTIARPHGRVTDAAAEVTLLEPEHPLLAWPNRIGAADFDGWVQERGLYFAERFDERYTPLLAMRDPGEAAQHGALLAAPVGDGWFVYTGLALFRQWPEGVPGAYRLLANLVSLGRQPAR